MDYELKLVNFNEITAYNVPKDCCVERYCSQIATWYATISLGSSEFHLMFCDEHGILFNSLMEEHHTKKPIEPTLMHEGYPLFLVDRDSDDPISVSFSCPRCGKVNFHGYSDEVGHRASHCGCWKHGYFIKPKVEE